MKPNFARRIERAKASVKRNRKSVARGLWAATAAAFLYAPAAHAQSTDFVFSGGLTGTITTSPPSSISGTYSFSATGPISQSLTPVTNGLSFDSDFPFTTWDLDSTFTTSVAVPGFRYRLTVEGNNGSGLDFGSAYNQYTFTYAGATGTGTIFDPLDQLRNEVTSPGFTSFVQRRTTESPPPGTPPGVTCRVLGSGALPNDCLSWSARGPAISGSGSVNFVALQGRTREGFLFTITSEADISVTKTVNDSILVPGQSSFYTIVIEHNGDNQQSAAIDLEVVDNLPTGITLGTASFVGAGGYSGGPSYSGGIIDVGNLDFGQSLTVTIPFTLDAGVSDGTVITNTIDPADITMVQTDPVDNQGALSASFTVEEPTIDLTKVGVLDDGGDGVANVGDVINYTFTVTNTGNFTLSEVTIADPLLVAPNGALSGGPIASLAAGAGDSTTFTGSYTLQQADIDAGAFENTATVTGDDPTGDPVTDVSDDPAETADVDPDGDGNPDDPTVVPLPQAPSLLATLTVGTPTVSGGALGSIPDAGDTIPYTLTVTNTGNITVNRLSVASTTGLTLGSCTPTLLAPGAQATCQVIDHTITPADVSAGGVEHSVTATATNLAGTLTTNDISDPGNGSESTEDQALFAGNDGNPTNDPTIFRLFTVGAGQPPLTATKSANQTSVLYGGTVIYTLTFQNSSATPFSNVVLHDRLPLGLAYTPGTATVNGVQREPQIGATLSWDNVTIPAGGSVVVTLAARVLSQDAGKELINTIFAADPTGLILSNQATATIYQKVEQIFDCSDLIGKVYDDLNQNGYQDQGEPGLAGVRIATVRGELITTDQYGRYHVPCHVLPAEIGSNVILKVDTRTLPSGYRMTAENPRVLRVTAGKMARINFGAAISNVVRLDLDATAFGIDADTGRAAMIRPLHSALDGLVAEFSEIPTTIRLRYHAGTGDEKVARRNLKIVEGYLRKAWPARSKDLLVIEREVSSRRE